MFFYSPYGVAFDTVRADPAAADPVRYCRGIFHGCRRCVESWLAAGSTADVRRDTLQSARLHDLDDRSQALVGAAIPHAMDASAPWDARGFRVAENRRLLGVAPSVAS